MFDEKLNLIEKGEEKEVKLLCTVTKRKWDEKKLAVSPFVSPVHFSFFSRTKKKKKKKKKERERERERKSCSILHSLTARTRQARPTKKVRAHALVTKYDISQLRAAGQISTPTRIVCRRDINHIMCSNNGL